MREVSHTWTSHVIQSVKYTLDAHVDIQSVNMLLCHVLYEIQHTGF